MRNFIAAVAAVIAAASVASIPSACADPQVGNGLTNGVDNGTNGNHSVLVQTVDGVTTVVVDGKTLTGAEAQPYIDEARLRAAANIDGWRRRDR
jgi:hypothetical protein